MEKCRAWRNFKNMWMEFHKRTNDTKTKNPNSLKKQSFLSKCCGTSYSLKQRKQKAPKKWSFSVNTEMMKNSEFMAGHVICKMYSMSCVTLWANSRERQRAQHRLNYHFKQSKILSSSHVRVILTRPGSTSGPAPLGWLFTPSWAVCRNADWR